MTLEFFFSLFIFLSNPFSLFSHVGNFVISFFHQILQFEINHLKYEHLESVEGYYTEDTGIEALQFKTNLRISEPIGYHHDGCTKFILAVEGKKIIGFHGSSFALRVGSLGAYFTWDTPTIIKAVGGKVGTKWDDGVNQAGFTKIHVRSGQKGIQFIKLEYVDKDGNLTDGPIHGSIYRRGSPHVVCIHYTCHGKIVIN